MPPFDSDLASQLLTSRRADLVLCSLPGPEAFQTFTRKEMDSMNESGQQQQDRMSELSPENLQASDASGTAAEPAEQEAEAHKIFVPGQGWVALSGAAHSSVTQACKLRPTAWRR